MTKKPEPDTEFVSIQECGFCGQKHGGYLRHYQLLQARCGNIYWALRPHRGAPLKLFPHPGFIVLTP